MKKEHAVSVSLTNGTECICNPDIVLGDKHGLWDLDNEISPRGTLLDLNAAWELFISKQGFSGYTFEQYEDSKHGKITYILVDQDKNPVGPKFTVDIDNIGGKTIQGVEWQDGFLYIWYNKKRPATDDEIAETVPVRFVLDEQGNRVYDETTGRPLVYEYVKIPIAEIFDNDETHKLFPWYADDQHTVRLRQNLDDDTIGHLGDFAITTDSEVFFAKQRYAPNAGNTLISLQSINDTYQNIIGTTLQYSDIEDPIIDTEGGNHHQRVSGYTNRLNTEITTSLVDAINGVQTTNDTAELLAFGHWKYDPATRQYHTEEGDITVQSDNKLDRSWIHPHFLIWAADWDEQYGKQGFAHINSLLGLINILQDEVGDPSKIPGESIANVLDELDTRDSSIETIIGWNPLLQKWYPINNRETTVIGGINKNTSDLLNMMWITGTELTPEEKLREGFPVYYNPQLHQILKDRINPSLGKDHVTLVQAINDLQTQIGDLATNLTTTAKTSTVAAINELDAKRGSLSNLTTTSKSNIVSAINELDGNSKSNTSKIGDLSSLNTGDKTNLVSAINETLTNISQVSEENPFEVYKVGTSKKGVQVKGKNNQAETDSLVTGRQNSAGEGSFVFGYSNNALSGRYSIIGGEYNRNDGNIGIIVGEHNNIILQNDEEESVVYANPEKNQIFGGNNTVTNALGNFISGSSNDITGNIIKQSGSYTGYGENNKVLGDDNTIIRGSDIFILGNSNLVRTVVRSNKDLSGNHIFGNTHEVAGDYNFIFGDSVSVTGYGNLIYGTGLDCNANNSIILMPSNANPAVFNYIDGETYIGGNINFALPFHSDQIQNVVFYDLNKFQKKFTNKTDISSLSELETVIKLYYSHIILSEPHTVAKFKMGNYQGYVIFENTTSVIVHYHDTWVQTLDITATPVIWQVKGGETLKVIQKNSKSYLALGDQNFSESTDPTIGPKTGSIQDIFSGWQAYGAIDLDDVWNAFDLTTKLNNKVDKSTNIRTIINNNGTPTYVDYPITDTVLSLEESFGFDKSLYQLLSEKGIAGGYAPLDSEGKVPLENLPIITEELIEVWAEYTTSETGEITNIHLFEYDEDSDPQKGAEILTGRSGVIYVQANNGNRQFRWSGTKWTPIGTSTLVLGEVTGTAYDGLKGKTTTDNVNSHIANTNNPHNVRASQLGVRVNDPNSKLNIEQLDPYYLTSTVDVHLQELYTRLNTQEDHAGAVSELLGTISEIQQLDNLPDSPSVIGEILKLHEELYSYIAIDDQEINSVLDNYLKFYGEN